MEGISTTDTLIGSPGKTYTMESGLTQTVNRYLQLIGNNCTPIQLNATQNGTLANLSMPANSRIRVNFAEIRDNNGVGGADFIAGSRSTDVNNSNQGWIFEDPPDFVEVGFLGPDRSLCNDDDLELNAFNFSPSETYQWNDNSTDTTLIVDMPGTYSVMVTFGNGCEIMDEINILSPQELSVELIPDTIICEGTSFVLDGTVPLEDAEYSWSDGEVGATRDVSEEGVYTIAVSVDGCTSQDMVEVSIQETPIIDLGIDQSFCEGETFSLDAEFMGATYEWQDGSMNQTFSGDMAGTYWAEVEINQCTFRDSIDITYVATPPAEIGNDTSLCEGIPLVLSTENVADAVITWQDGTTGTDFNVTAEGPHVVTVDINGCINQDSIYVTFQQLARFDLGEDQNFCEGEPFTLDATVPESVTYEWQDGSTSPTFSGNMGGLYYATTNINDCEFSDSINIDYVPLPESEIGNDTLLCDGDLLNLTVGETTGATYTWQDGTDGRDYQVSTEGPIKVVVDVMGCANQDSIYVAYQQASNLDLGEDLSGCEGDDFNLISNVTGDEYMWSTGDTDNMINVTASGQYILSVVEGVCELSDTVDVLISLFPEVDLGPADTSLCSGDVWVVTTEIPGLWQDGTTSDSYTINSEGSFSVILDNNGCLTQESVNVAILPRPNVDLGQDINLCDGELADLSAAADLIDFTWEDGSSDRDRVINATGLYWLNAIENGCDSRDSIFISFQELPSVELGFDTTVCDDTGIVLTPQKTEGRITWQDGSTGDSYNVQEEGLIRAVIDINGCETEDEVFITFRTCFYFDSYIPNIFSPNSDGNNETFVPSFRDGVTINSYSISIFDRWGNQVFTSTSLDESWDGRIGDANSADPGVYVYIVKVDYTDDRTSGEQTITGDITIIR